MSSATHLHPASGSNRSPSRAELEEENRQLREGLASRALIGQATGVVMIQLEVDAQVAFAYLRRRSMHENRKLVSIAQEIVGSRTLDGA